MGSFLVIIIIIIIIDDLVYKSFVILIVAFPFSFLSLSHVAGLVLIDPLVETIFDKNSSWQNHWYALLYSLWFIDSSQYFTYTTIMYTARAYIVLGHKFQGIQIEA